MDDKTENSFSHIKGKGIVFSQDAFPSLNKLCKANKQLLLS